MVGIITGSISGTVTGSDGQPLVAVITALGPTPGRAQSSANGAFTLSSLAPGRYQLCAAVKTAGYLDPCAWEPVLPMVQVVARQATTGYRLVAKKGARFQVRLNDPAALLSATAAPRAPHVLLGVFSVRRVFQPLAVSGRDAGGVNEEATVPLDVPFSLQIRATNAQLSDETGAMVASGGVLRTYIQPSKGPLKTATFTVRP